jgi:hypothetical protein
VQNFPCILNEIATESGKHRSTVNLALRKYSAAASLPLLAHLDRRSQLQHQH